MTDADKPNALNWYRTPIAPDVFRRLRERSDARGLLQALGFLSVFLVLGSLAVYSVGNWPWYTTFLLVYLYGTCNSFQINAVHELGHGSVFRTRGLNTAFERVFAFLGWINFRHFTTSHVRHHDYTLHPPDDLEVVLPTRIKRRDFYRSFLNLRAPIWPIRESCRLAAGRFQGEWELKLFPESAPERRQPVMRWARRLLAGHALIAIGSVAAAVAFGPRFLLIPLMVSLSSAYGGWLFFLCNNTQHIGLRDNVPDFRLCCRTFLLNPVARFLYWHMNYHTEHHMYPLVPCYRLAALHRVIRHDLPPCPRGIVAVWREIAAIQARQDREPGYQHAAPLPAPAASPAPT